MEKIDLVVPYVDGSDKNWQKLFNQYNPKTVAEGINAVNRFRGQGDFFRYFFRCIATNLPFINNVFLLVQSESQVPKWINKDNVKIITHDKFIPAEFLPTFNSCTIEMFLWNIPELSEKFLYFNDDIFVLNRLTTDMIFSQNGIKQRLTTRCDGGMYGQQCKNSAALIYGSATFKKCEHDFRPYFKSRMLECFNIYKQDILSSISMFRSTNNFNCYIYSLYLDKLGLVSAPSIKNAYISNEKSTFGNADVICINDPNTKESIYESKRLNDFFSKKFWKKSKYEINDFPNAVDRSKFLQIRQSEKKYDKPQTFTGWGF